MPREIWILLLALLTGCQNFQSFGDLDSPLKEGIQTPSHNSDYYEGRRSNDGGPLFFDWPVEKARVSQYFKGNRIDPHYGIDLAAHLGAKIHASLGGQVIYAGNAFSGYGSLVIIELNSKWATLYSHLSRILVREGQWVEKGQVIGQMGATGNATGVHLHFEVRHKKLPVDPLMYLPTPSPFLTTKKSKL